MSKFTLNVDGEPPVAVTLAVPGGWSLDGSMPDPAWRRDGALMLSLAAVSPSGDDDAARVARAIKMQYDAVADTERTELSGGRVWIARQEGENLHARMFVPYPGGVVAWRSSAPRARRRCPRCARRSRPWRSTVTDAARLDDRHPRITPRERTSTWVMGVAILGAEGAAALPEVRAARAIDG
jgi:hypothetical protein